MGTCASSQTTRRGGDINWPSTAKVIHEDGKLQEFRQPMKAGYVISQNPNCFLCSSESMYLDSYMPHVPDNEELQLGQIYFLMPLSQSHKPLSLSDICVLAVKASTALSKQDLEPQPSRKASLISNRRAVRLPAISVGGCKNPASFDVAGGFGSHVGRSNRGVGY